MRDAKTEIEKLREKIPTGREPNMLWVMLGRDYFYFQHETKRPLKGGVHDKNGMTRYPIEMVEEVGEYINQEPRYIEFDGFGGL